MAERAIALCRLQQPRLDLGKSFIRKKPFLAGERADGCRENAGDHRD